MLKSIRPFFVILILFGATVALYYGSLIGNYFHPNVISLDDEGLMFSLFNHRLSLGDIFSFGAFGKYYRPFLTLSFFIDQRLYGDVAFSFRLTNILIHTANVILLYALVRMLLRHATRGQEIAFFSAALFAVHPAAVESVSWISGRTDSLAVFWSLLAFIFYLSGATRNKWYLSLISLFCAVAAVLAKEVGIAIPIVIIAWELFYRRSFGFEAIRSKYMLFIFSLYIALVPLYLYFRTLGLSAGDVGSGLIKSSLMSQGILSSFNLFLASIGFYLKKYVCPFPLNIAIAHINTTLYAIVGLLFLLSIIGLFFLKNFRKYHFFLFWAFIGIVPAALISFTTIAWTPWAERYLYFSLLPLSIFIVLCFFLLLEHQGGQIGRSLPFVGLSVLLIFAVATVHRSFVWNDNLKLWEDAYKKSPGFMYAAVGYANALMRKDKKTEAEKVLHSARSLPGAKHEVFLHLGHISCERGQMSDAKKYYQMALREAETDKNLVLMGPALKSGILESMADLELKEADKANDQMIKKRRYREAITNFLRAYSMDHSQVFLLYRIAKLYLALGSKNDAALYFREFIEKWGDDHYKESAKKMLEHIESNMNKDVVGKCNREPTQGNFI